VRRTCQPWLGKGALTFERPAGFLAEEKATVFWQREKRTQLIFLLCVALGRRMLHLLGRAAARAVPRAVAAIPMRHKSVAQSVPDELLR
jgi:hypothetical protein